MDKILFFLFSSQNGCISAGMTDFIAALADLILPELMGGYAPEYVNITNKISFTLKNCQK